MSDDELLELESQQQSLTRTIQAKQVRLKSVLASLGKINEREQKAETLVRLCRERKQELLAMEAVPLAEWKVNSSVLEQAIDHTIDARNDRAQTHNSIKELETHITEMQLILQTVQDRLAETAEIIQFPANDYIRSKGKD